MKFDRPIRELDLVAIPLDAAQRERIEREGTVVWHVSGADIATVECRVAHGEPLDTVLLDFKVSELRRISRLRPIARRVAFAVLQIVGSLCVIAAASTVIDLSNTVLPFHIPNFIDFWNRWDYWLIPISAVFAVSALRRERDADGDPPPPPFN